MLICILHSNMHLVVNLSRYPLPNLGMLCYHLHIYNYLKAFFIYGNLGKKGDLLKDYLLSKESQSRKNTRDNVISGESVQHDGTQLR